MTKKLVAGLILVLAGCGGKDISGVPYANSALFSPDNKRLIICRTHRPRDQSGKPKYLYRPVTVWDLSKSQELPGKFPYIDKGVAAFVADGKQVLSGNASQVGKVALYLWETDTGQIIREFPDEDLQPHQNDVVTALRVSADGKVAITRNFRGRFNIWDVREGKHIRTLGEGDLPPSPGDVTFLSVRKAICASEDKVILWDLATRKEVKSWGLHIPFIDLQAAVAENTLLLFSKYGTGKNILLWEFPSGKIIRQFRSAPLLGATLTPDGKTLLYGCTNGLLVREDVVTGEKIWSVHQPGLTAVAFSQDGTLAFTGGRDGTMILWDAVEGKQSRSLTASPP